MNGIAIVQQVDYEERRVDVVVYPESCGRCEDNGGHCTRDHRVVPVQLPDEMDLKPGDHLRLGASGTAIFRAVRRLVIAPIGSAVVGFWIGGGRFREIAPRAVRQLIGDGSVSLGIPTAAIVLAALGVALAIGIGVVRGTQRDDWPIVAERVLHQPTPRSYQSGATEMPVLKNVPITPR